ncbi:hypothetical protein RND81_09G067000 [Saponaria officinalis]|uniref:GBF-interacting protein 1 N-terminal domain-containing protein n=1 Tax=Saponaria officinalis TaxID=3572 RepID=A0AAW1IHH4_SAPOF
MSNNGGFSTSKVLIPNIVKKTIQNIKEIAKNHTEDDIYAMLKECSMDPNETTQRLLYLDTFHQVKSKRDKRKEAVKSRPEEDFRWQSGHHVRVTWRDRGNTYSKYTSDDSGGRKSNFIQKANGDTQIREKAFRTATTPAIKETNTVHVEKALSIPINKSAKHNGSKPPAPSASNPVLVPSGDSLIPTAIDATKREVRIGQISIVSNAHVPVDNGLSKSESSNSPHKTDKSPAFSSVIEKQASQPENVAQTNVPRDPVVAEKSHAPSRESAVRPSSLSGADEAASESVKLKIFHDQHVIIPDHIQVPDAIKNVLSFGSINASFRAACVKIKNAKHLQSAGDVSQDKATEISSSCDKDAVSTLKQTEYTDNQWSRSNSPDEDYPVDIKDLSSTATDDQLKVDNLLAVGPPFPILQTSSNYSFGFMPPMLANALLQSGGFENQAWFSSSVSGDSPARLTLSSTPPPTQSAGVGQAVPLFSRPYSPSYIPYSHYFPPFYVPPGMHPYYAHTIFPQPLPNGDVLLSTPTTTKTSPAHFKMGPNAGNQTPAGVSSGNVVHSSYQVGFSPNPTMTFGNSGTSAGLTPTVFKDRNIYSGQQNEGYGAWLPTVNIPMNSLLNFPQGQHVINPQSTHGGFTVYHALQPVPTTAPGQTVTGRVEPVGPPSSAYQHSQRQHQASFSMNV